MILPAEHPLRRALNAELHARQPEALSAPLRLTFLALYSDPSERSTELDHVGTLAVAHGVQPPPRGAAHFSADLGAFRLKFERHSEFTRYKFIAAGAAGEPFEQTALQAVPADWLKQVPGQLMVATHVVLLPAPTAPPDVDALATRYFAGNALVGAGIAGGAGMAFTDYRLHDGFGRLVVLDRGMSQRQAGRMVQRLLEIDSYRLMALLALPVAQGLTPWLTQAERELAEVSASLLEASEANEPALLEQLTRLEAQIESRESEHHFRFTAAEAYQRLVQRRVEELREVRIDGVQNFEEFTERRLAPAMSTCRSVWARIESLSQRVARATQLLSTRVDISRERQNQQLLESMNRRSAAQLRLQQTVEGLSVAAITYYIVGLVGYAAKGLHAAGMHVNVEAATAVSIPLVAVAVAYGVRHARRIVSHAVQ
ncbi:MAG TPA: DUF3422 domain-containing protein [Steroidobacteraceae bacterium]|nr:DUF3422 domain-containing protein [Steroidobacteraceae bacterium]